MLGHDRLLPGEVADLSPTVGEVAVAAHEPVDGVRTRFRWPVEGDQPDRPQARFPQRFQCTDGYRAIRSATVAYGTIGKIV